VNADEIRVELQKKVGELELVPGPGDAAIIVPADKWHEAARHMRDVPELAFGFLRSYCGVDRPQANQIEVVAHLYSYTRRHGIVLKTKVARSGGELATVSDVWPAAEWHERELYDLFGVRLLGHPDLRRLLLPDDWVGHPLLKDYKEPPDYHGIPMQRPAPAEPAPAQSSEAR
jgi:NADH-quinone oxidoreductase subunit C